MFRLRPLLSLSRGTTTTTTTSSILRRKPGFNIANLCLRLTHSCTSSTLPNLPLFAALKDHNPSRTAIVHSASSRSFTYGNLVADVLRAKQDLLAKAGDKGLAGERIPFLIENSYDYVGISPFLFCVLLCFELLGWVGANVCSDAACNPRC